MHYWVDHQAESEHQSESNRGVPNLNALPTPTAVLAELVRTQASTNAELARKQARLIEHLRSELGSDPAVLDELMDLLGFRASFRGGLARPRPESQKFGGKSGGEGDGTGRDSCGG